MWVSVRPRDPTRGIVREELLKRCNTFCVARLARALQRVDCVVGYFLRGFAVLFEQCPHHGTCRPVAMNVSPEAVVIEAGRRIVGG